MHNEHYRLRAIVIAAAVVAAGGARAWPPLRGQEVASSARSRQDAAPAASPMFQSTDLYRLKSVGDVQVSPDGTRVAYSIQNND